MRGGGPRGSESFRERQRRPAARPRKRRRQQSTRDNERVTLPASPGHSQNDARKCQLTVSDPQLNVGALMEKGIRLIGNGQAPVHMWWHEILNDYILTGKFDPTL